MHKPMRPLMTSHLASTLGAVVDSPLVFVLVHNAVVDADAAANADAVHDQLVLVRLVGESPTESVM